MVYDDYTMEEVIALMNKQYPRCEPPPLSPIMLKQTMQLMNGLQEIYGAEEKEIDDDSLFMEAVMFAYHIDELKELILYIL